MSSTTYTDVFTGIPVSDYATAVSWYERLFGTSPAFYPHDTEAVWELADHRYVYVVQAPERAGYAVLTIFVDDLDTLVARITDSGIEPAQREAYQNDIRKITYRDADGNEVGFGGAPRGDTTNEN